MQLISREEMKECVDSDCGAVLIDARMESDYAEGHIPGAINMPAEKAQEKAPQILRNKSQRVITYCGSPQCPLSRKAAETLERLGYTDVGAFEGGMKEWREAGYPVARGNSAQAA
jgi:rhodanese-related sulfurtransferase